MNNFTAKIRLFSQLTIYFMNLFYGMTIKIRNFAL